MSTSSFHFLVLKATKTPESWEGVRDCTYYGDVCPQSDENGELIGSEDCLYLNVFMPTVNPSPLSTSLIKTHCYNLLLV